MENFPRSCDAVSELAVDDRSPRDDSDDDLSGVIWRDAATSMEPKAGRVAPVSQWISIVSFGVDKRVPPSSDCDRCHSSSACQSKNACYAIEPTTR